MGTFFFRWMISTCYFKPSSQVLIYLVTNCIIIYFSLKWLTFLLSFFLKQYFNEIMGLIVEIMVVNFFLINIKHVTIKIKNIHLTTSNQLGWNGCISHSGKHCLRLSETTKNLHTWPINSTSYRIVFWKCSLMLWILFYMLYFKYLKSVL